MLRDGSAWMLVLATGLLANLSLQVAAADNAPRLGEVVSAQDLAALNITVLPSGEGLPSGSGSAVAGRKVYLTHCQVCHGADGTGGPNDALTGGIGSLATAQPVKSVGSFWPYATTLFDYVRRAMPYTSPGLLSNDESYAVTAYVLFMNGIVAEDAVLDTATLAKVVMPNAKGFRQSMSDVN
jgi:cytochrome c